jgi:5-methylcytosine-specific restriction endonuclease McrA
VIPVQLAAEPPAFDATVRVPGNRALYEMTGRPVPEAYKRTRGRKHAQRKDANGKLITDPAELPAKVLPDYWTSALDDLASAYAHICAFTCFRIHEVTGARSVDHMVPKSVAHDRAYEWDNYRLACSAVNARKNDRVMLLDPFDVAPGWFELEFAGGQVLPGAAVRDDVGLTTWLWAVIDLLALNQPSHRNRRLADVRLYRDRHIDFAHLAWTSPFVARELQRQGQLLPARI